MTSKRITFAHDQAPLRGTLVTRSVTLPLPRVSADVRPWLFVIAALCLVSVLAFVQLSQASYVARQLDEMSRLESDMLAIRQRNNTLRLKIAEYGRMPRIVQEARALGLGEAERVEYVAVSISGMPATAQTRTQPEQAQPLANSLHLPSWLQAAFREFAELVRIAGVQPEPRSG